VYADLVLTRDPPVVDADKREIRLDLVSDGIFFTGTFPFRAVLGGLIEISSEPEEDGYFEIRAVGRVAGTDEERLLFLWPLVIPPCSSDWKRPRVWSYPFAFDLTTSAPFDLTVGFYAGDEFLADRVLLVRELAVPDYPPDE
jgi:hypothetical protein